MRKRVTKKREKKNEKIGQTRILQTTLLRKGEISFSGSTECHEKNCVNQ